MTNKLYTNMIEFETRLPFSIMIRQPKLCGLNNTYIFAPHPPIVRS